MALGVTRPLLGLTTYQIRYDLPGLFTKGYFSVIKKSSVEEALQVASRPRLLSLRVLMILA